MAKRAAQRLRFSFDLGTNSIGWCVLGLQRDNRPGKFVDAGVRIFSDGRNPKDKTSLAVARRTARSMRRRRDRYLRRRRKLLHALTEFGLMPEDPAERARLAQLDPYEIRASALEKAVLPYQFGRALFHLNQRRGFKSNRKADEADDERGKIRQGVGKLRDAMKKAGADTLGKYLHGLHATGQSVRARLTPQPTDGNNMVPGYDFYPERDAV